MSQATIIVRTERDTAGNVTREYSWIGDEGAPVYVAPEFVNGDAFETMLAEMPWRLARAPEHDTPFQLAFVRSTE